MNHHKFQLPLVRRKMLCEKNLSQERLMENFFLNLCEGLEIKGNRIKLKYSTFFFKKQKCVFEIWNDQFRCSYLNYTIPFEDEFELYGFSENLFREFTKLMVEKHFKFAVGTHHVLLRINWGRDLNKILKNEH